MATNATQIVITAKDETQQAIKGVQAGLATLERQAIGLGPIFGAMGAALSIGAFKSAISNTIEFAARLDDMSEATGASVENLSALSSVAKVGGHDLGNVEAALQKLGKALHSTDDESKGAAKGLAAIGLSVEDLRSKDPAEAMLDIAKAMDQFKDGSGKAAVAMAILGKSGAQMLPFLKDLAEQERLLGKVTAEQAAMAEEYEKNITRLSASFSQAGKAAALELLPYLNKITAEMLDGVKAAGGFWSALSAGATINPFKTNAENLKTVRADLEQIEKDAKESGYMDEQRFNRKKAQYEILKAEQRRIALGDKPEQNMDANDRKFARKASLDNFVSAADKPDKKTALKAEADAAQSLIEKLDRQISVRALDLVTTEKLTAAEKEAAEVRQQLDAGTLKATDSQRKLIDGKLAFLVAADKEIAAQEKSKKAAEDLAKVELLIGDYRQNNATTLERIKRENELALMTDRQREVTEALYRVEDEGQKIRERIIRDLPDEIAQKEALAKVEGELAAQKEKVAEAVGRNQESSRTFAFGWQKSFQEYSDNASNSANSARDAFQATSAAMEDAIVSFTTTGKASYRDFAQSVLKSLSQIAAKQAAMGLMKLATSVAGAYFGGAGNSAGLGGYANGGAFGSGGEIHAFANGGIVSSPTLFKFAKGTGLMGEAGPEAIMPLSRDASGRLGVKSQGSSGGDISLTQVFNITGGSESGGKDGAGSDSGGFKQFADMMAGVTRQVIVQEMRSGGMLEKARAA